MRIFMAVLLLQFTTTAFADFPAFQISPSGSSPQVSGNNVVWGSENEIDVYNLNTKTTTVINAPDNDGTPGIDNDIVVWTQDSGVYGYRISTGQQFTVAASVISKGGARVSGNTIVRIESQNSIYGYDIASGTEFPICVSPEISRGLPVISGNYVAWQDQRNMGTSSYVDVFGFDLQTKTEFPVCTAEGWQGDCGIGSNIVTWTDTRDGLESIYGYNILTETEFHIATEQGIDGSAISGNYLVWSDHRGRESVDSDIYGYDLSTNTEFAISTASGRQCWPSISGNTVVWLGDDGGIYGTVIPEPASLLLFSLAWPLGRGLILRKRKT